MIAEATPLQQLFEGSKQFEVPIYQRTYSWTDDERRQLWADLLRAGRNPKVTAHFIGSVVYIQNAGTMAGSVTRARLIDGQQRVTTIMLLLVALVQRLRETGDLVLTVETEDGDEYTETITADRLRDTLLLNSNVSGDVRYKLILTQADRATLMHYVGGVPLPDQPSKNVRDAYAFFSARLRDPNVSVRDVFLGLRKLQIVNVTLEQGKDDPQLIFESLNSTGKDLTQADLIRNYVLMALPTKEQRELYEHFWFPMEQLFGGDYADTFDRFVRDYLTMRTRTIPNQRQVYQAFKTYRQEKVSKVPDLVADIAAHARHYARLVNPALESDLQVRSALQDLAALEVKVSYPFVLEVLEDYAQNRLTRDELVRVLRLVEAYVLRRAICGVPTNTLNKTFAALAKDINKAEYVRSLERALMRLPGAQYFPGDEEFKRELAVKHLYGMDVCKFVLGKLENFGHKEPVPTASLTIEHVMPQNEKLSAAWREMLGEHWQDVQARYVHTIGNLTLTGYNSELGDRPFQEKQTLPEPKGYASSHLRLTRKLADLDRWDEAAIQARAAELSVLAVKAWPQPTFTSEELAELRAEPAKGKPAESYTVAWHLEGASPALQELFGDLQAGMLTLHDSVQEVPKKEYIGYKVGTNFCDVKVQPGVNQLRVWLNLPFAALSDDAGLARDVTNIGHHGNGHAEVVLQPGADLEAFLVLARQVLAYQVARPKAEKKSFDERLAELPSEQQDVYAELERRLLALAPGIQRRLMQTWVRFHAPSPSAKAICSVATREEGLRLWVQLPLEEIERHSGTATGFARDDAKWSCTTLTSAADLDAAWPAVEQAYYDQRNGAVDETEGVLAALAALPDGAQEVRRDLEARLVALSPEVGRRVLKHYVSYRMRQAFIELVPRSEALYIRVRLPGGVGDLEDAPAWKLTQFKGWWHRLLRTPHDLTQAWPVIKEAFGRQVREPRPVTQAAINAFLALQSDDERVLAEELLERSIQLADAVPRMSKVSYSVDRQVAGAKRVFLEVKPTGKGWVKVYTYADFADAQALGVQDEVQTRQGCLTFQVADDVSLQRFWPLVQRAYDLHAPEDTVVSDA